MAVYLTYPTDEQKKYLKAFLEAMKISFVEIDEMDEAELPPHVLDGISEGQADFEAGRFITLEEFKKRFPV